MTNLLESSTTLDDFMVERIIGKGSFGSVYLVKRKIDQKLYALKSVLLEKLNKKEQENSVNEVRLLSSVYHPNVISYKEAFFDDNNNSLNIIMEYAENGDLQTEIIKRKKEKEMFNEEIIWLYSIQMIEGLKALHDKKIMHRDLKSANIFLSKNKLQCKLGDMNVSKVIKEKVLRTQTGTPYYASPEVWRDEPYSYKSDLWSIGCVIYEMCQFEPPFNGKDLDELFENVCLGKTKRINKCYSDDLWKMILMLLQNDPEKRVNCEEFLDSDLIRNKINELKNNPNTNYEGYLLEENINLKNENDFLLETIKFKSFKDLKNNLPSLKNYESNYNKRIGNKSNNKNSNSNRKYKLKNINLNTLTLNSGKKNYNNKKNSLHNEREKLFLKRLHKNISFTKENQNPNFSKKNNSNYSIENSHNIINIKRRKIILQHPKKIEIKYKKKSIPINIKREKKLLIKNLERKSELNKIKDFMKVNKKEKLTIKTERSKNYINKKSNRNLLENQTEYDKIKLISISKKSLHNKSPAKRINTEHKISIINKIYNKNFNKLLNKKMIKSPTSVSIESKLNKLRSHSYKIINKKIMIPTKNKLKDLFYKIFKDINLKDKRNKSYKYKKKLKPFIPFLINNKSFKEKTNKRNLTTISNEQEPKKEININSNKTIKKDILFNQIFNTMNSKKEKKYKKINSNYHYYINTGNYSANDRRQKIVKKMKIIYKNNKKPKENFSFTSKIKKILNKDFSDNNSHNNIYINVNTSCSKHNDNNDITIKRIFTNKNIKRINNLFNFKNYSIITKADKSNFIAKEESKINNNSDYDDISITNYKIIKNQKKLNKKINESYKPISFRLKTLSSSNRYNLSKSNIDLKKKRNFISDKLNKIKNDKNIKNFNIKKLTIPMSHRKDNRKNDILKNKINFKSQKNILKTDTNNYHQNYNNSNRERKYKIGKINKNFLNISENNNYIISNHNTIFQNINPIYLNIKGNNNLNLLYKRKLKNNIKNKRINTTNLQSDLKVDKIIKDGIFNNCYSINNFETSMPVKVINLYNIPN